MLEGRDNMSLWDVIKGKQSFGSWITGRSPKEHDVYANPELVDKVSAEIKSIATTGVSNARDAVFEAMRQLNYSAQNCGTIEVSKFESVFDGISETITSLATQLEGKVADIKKYEESSFLEKVGSTVFMGVSKVGEGLLSVVEDLGDGVLSIVGWGAGKLGAKGVQNSIGEFVKKDISHDVFDKIYYSTDFAKASVFTEDSALAGACKLGGKAIGYLYAGGVASGIMQSAGITSTAIASTTTLGATTAGFIGGIGSRTQAGLQSGLDYNDAFGAGIKTGAIQGGMAFLGGKLSEHAQAVKGGVTGKAAWRGDTQINGKYVQGYTDKITQAGERFGKASYKTIQSGLDVLRVKSGNSVTRVDKTAVANAEKNLADKTQAFEKWKADNPNATNRQIGRQKAEITKARGALDKASQKTELTLDQAKAAFKDNLKQLKVDNPLSQSVSAVKGVKATVATKVSSTVSKVKNIKQVGVKNTIKTAASGAKSSAGNAVQTFKSGVTNTLKHPIKATGSLVKGTVSTVGKVAGKAITVGAVPVGVAVNDYVKTSGREAEALIKKYEGYNDTINNTSTAMVETVQQVVGDAPISSSSTFRAGAATAGASKDDRGTSTTTQTVSGDTSSEQVLTGDGETTQQTSSSGARVSGGHTGGGYSGGSYTGGGYTGGGYTTGGSSYEPYQPAAMEETPISTGVTVSPSTTSLQDPTVTAPSTQQISPEQVVNPIPVPDVPTPQPVPQTLTPASTTYNPQPAYTGGYTGQSQTTHAGGSYGTTGFSADSATVTTDPSSLSSSVTASLMADTKGTIDEIMSGNKYSKIPTSIKPTQAIKPKTASAIPLAAGLAAASAAGIGAKAYVDHKNNNSIEEESEEDDDFEYDEWNEDSLSDESIQEIKGNRDENEYYEATDVMSGDFNQLAEI